MRSVWTPPSRPIRQSQHFRLTWNGLTYRDYDNQYINGCEDARSGRALEAETKLRAALDGFHNLLSTTDQKCVEVARKLAIFYAEHERIREAELIFDWLTEAHVQEFGRADRKTYDYLLSVVRFYQDQHRPREAAALLDRIILTCEENKDQAARPKHPEVNIAAQTSQSGYEHQVSHLPENASGTAWLYEGLDEIESAQPGDESVDEVWNDLLKRCEDLPEQLTSHSLLVHTALVKHQAQSGHTRKLNEAIEQADRVINRLLHSNQLKTDDLYDSCVRLAKEFAKAGRYSSANKAFSRIESDAQDSSSFDPARRIELLKSIGIFYQNEGRWEDAAPRFEQALAASLSLYCTGNHEVRRLETALENRHYSVDSSHDEDHTHCRPIPTYRVDGVPEVVVVVARQRNWLE
jgi:tetratricopeptide (TPR) repeat protein